MTAKQDVPMKAGSLPLVSRRTAAEVLALSVRTFERLDAEGVLVAAQPGRGGRQSLYDLRVIVPAYLIHERKSRAAVGEDETPRERRDRSQAELNELRLARERRELLPRDQVVADGRAFVFATTAKIRALPRRLSRAGLIAGEDEAAVATLLVEAQEEIARWSSQLDLLAAVEQV